MNNNFNDAKDFFNKNGYCQFSLKDFDIDFYNFLDKFLSCNGEDNLKEMFHTFRFDSNTKNVRYMSPNRSFTDAEEKQINLFSECEDHSKISQAWYFQNDMNYIQSFLQNRNSDLIGMDVKRIIQNATNNILKYFYEEVDSNDISHDELQFSFYDVNNVFTPHSDGMTVNLCSILIYLNKDYNKENGGVLLLNGEEVIPELGMVALMDLSKHDINHGVTKVLSKPGRYAIFNFPKLKSVI